MDCREFEQILESYLEGENLPGAEEHLAQCRRCRELCSLMSGDLDITGIDTPADLAGQVLEATSGSPCDRATLLMCDFVDGGLEDLDRELMTLHLGTCPECSALEAALIRMADELPRYAERQPDERFLSDVMTATIGVRAPEQPETFWTKAARIWESLLSRPRLALEGAYLGTFILLLAFGSPLSPAKEIPGEAMEVVRKAPAVVGAQVARIEEEVKKKAEEKVLTPARSLKEDLSGKADELQSAGRSYYQTFREDGLKGVWQMIFEEERSEENSDNQD